MEEGALRTVTRALPAFRRFGDEPEVFFNSIVAARGGWSDARNTPEQSVRFGDGSPLSPDVIAMLEYVENTWLPDHASSTEWICGDVLLIDNHRVLHARAPFTPSRSILAALRGPRRRPIRA